MVPRVLDRILERLVQEIERQIRVHGGIAVGFQRHLLGRGIERELEFLGKREGHVGAGPHHELEMCRELDPAGFPFERGTRLELKREFDALLQGNAEDRHVDGGDFPLEVADRLGHLVEERLQQVLDMFLAGGEREAARIGEVVVEILDAACGQWRVRQLDRQGDDLVRAAADDLEFGEGEFRRKIDRLRREFLAHDVPHLAGDPRHFGVREARARGGDELNLAVLRRGAHGQFPAGCARENRKFERGAHLAMQRMVCGGNFPGSGIRIVMGSDIRQQRRFGGGAVGQDDGGRGKLQLHAAARFL